MKIISNWISPGDLIKNEIYTLKEMMNNSKLNQIQSMFSNDAKVTFFKYKDNPITKKNFCFNSFIDFPNDHIVNKAILECLIIIDTTDPNEFDLLTYSFGLISRKNGQKDYLIRKFHIDFTNTPDTGRPPLHPIFHLQYPGKITSKIEKLGVTDTHLDPFLSEPRFCTSPTTLALLTDFLLREFGGDSISPLTKLTKEPRWRDLIKKNEELVLKPYFTACHSFFHDRSCKKRPEKQQLFTQDFLYGRK